jgi:trans-aconitate methyltransferase
LRNSPDELLASLDISRALHPNDVMVREKTTEAQYFAVGGQAALIIHGALLARYLHTRSWPEAPGILDFGCGYGRVTRYMRAIFPKSRIVASDVLTEGVDFCAAEFGAAPHYSKARLEEIGFEETFDLTFVGSVFTHISADRAQTLLDLLIERLNPDGVLIFTTHGRKVIDNILHGKQHNPMKDATLQGVRDYYTKGYGYADYETQYYKEPVGYGTSLMQIGWALDYIASRNDVTLLSAQERGWNNHQDVLSVIRRRL